MTTRQIFIGVLSVSAVLIGCAQSGSSSSSPAPKVEIAQHKAEECPANIEGVYKGKSKSGLDLTIEFFRNEKNALFHKMTIKGEESDALTVAVDGEKHTFEGVDGYISMGCQNSKISGVNVLKGTTYKGTFSLVGDDLKSEAIAPETLQLIFKRVKSANDQNFIKVPTYKNVEFFGCKGTDLTSVCQDSATKICQFYNFNFAEEYETSVTRRGYIKPGERLAFFKDDGSPYIEEFHSLKDSVAVTFNYVKCR